MQKKFKGLTVAALGGMALTVVVAAIIISMGSSILSGLQDIQEEIAYVTVTNEGPYIFPNATDATPYNLNVTYYPVTSITIFNGTSVVTLSLNYSVVNAALGQYNITNWNNSLGDTESVEVNYTYSRPEYTTAYNATGKGLTGMITFANWIPMIALVVVAAIVIGVIVTYLGKAGGAA